MVSTFQRERTSYTRFFSSTEASEDINSGKARVVFLGTPDVAATTLERIVEESKKDER